MKVFHILSLLALVYCVNTEDDGQARLLVAKSVLNEYLVEGKDLTVEYLLYNVGGSAALNVELKENSFPKSEFDVVQGFLQAKWDRLAPGSNVTHSVILRPLKGGIFNVTAADITYLPAEGAAKQNAYSSPVGRMRILSLKDYDRLFSPHIMDWAAFAIMTLPSIGFPWVLWYRSSSKYNIKSKRN